VPLFAVLRNVCDMNEEWQERPKGQTSSWVLTAGFLLLGLANGFVVVPRRDGGWRGLAIVSTLVWFALAGRNFRRGRQGSR
jgi:hypothetical protein